MPVRHPTLQQMKEEARQTKRKRGRVISGSVSAVASVFASFSVALNACSLPHPSCPCKPFQSAKPLPSVVLLEWSHITTLWEPRSLVGFLKFTEGRLSTALQGPNFLNHGTNLVKRSFHRIPSQDNFLL